MKNKKEVKETYDTLRAGLTELSKFTEAKKNIPLAQLIKESAEINQLATQNEKLINLVKNCLANERAEDSSNSVQNEIITLFFSVPNNQAALKSKLAQTKKAITKETISEQRKAMGKRIAATVHSKVKVEDYAEHINLCLLEMMDKIVCLARYAQIQAFIDKDSTIVIQQLVEKIGERVAPGTVPVFLHLAQINWTTLKIALQRKLPIQPVASGTNVSSTASLASSENLSSNTSTAFNLDNAPSTSFKSALIPAIIASQPSSNSQAVSPSANTKPTPHLSSNEPNPYQEYSEIETTFRKLNGEMLPQTTLPSTSANAFNLTKLTVLAKKQLQTESAKISEIPERYRIEFQKLQAIHIKKCELLYKPCNTSLQLYHENELSYHTVEKNFFLPALKNLLDEINYLDKKTSKLIKRFQREFIDLLEDTIKKDNIADVITPITFFLEQTNLFKTTYLDKIFTDLHELIRYSSDPKNTIQSIISILNAEMEKQAKNIAELANASSLHANPHGYSHAIKIRDICNRYINSYKIRHLAKLKDFYETEIKDLNAIIALPYQALETIEESFNEIKEELQTLLDIQLDPTKEEILSEVTLLLLNSAKEHKNKISNYLDIDLGLTSKEFIEKLNEIIQNKENKEKLLAFLKLDKNLTHEALIAELNKLILGEEAKNTIATQVGLSCELDCSSFLAVIADWLSEKNNKKLLQHCLGLDQTPNSLLETINQLLADESALDTLETTSQALQPLNALEEETQLKKAEHNIAERLQIYAKKIKTLQLKQAIETETNPLPKGPKEKLEAAEKENAKLFRKLEDFRITNETLQSKYEEISTELQSAQTKKNEIEQALARLETERDSFFDGKVAADQALSSIEQQYASLNEAFTAYKSETIAKISEQEKKQKENINDLEEKAQSLTQKLQIEEKKTQCNTETIAKFNTEVTQNARTLDEEKAKSFRLENEARELLNKISLLESQLQERVDQLIGVKSELEENRRELGDKITHYEELQKDNADKIAALQLQIQTINSELEAEKTKVGSNIELVNRLNDEILQKNSELLVEKKTSSDLERQINRLQIENLVQKGKLSETESSYHEGLKSKEEKNRLLTQELKDLSHKCALFISKVKDELSELTLDEVRKIFSQKQKDFYSIALADDSDSEDEDFGDEPDQSPYNKALLFEQFDKLQEAITTALTQLTQKNKTSSVIPIPKTDRLSPLLPSAKHDEDGNFFNIESSSPADDIEFDWDTNDTTYLSQPALENRYSVLEKQLEETNEKIFELENKLHEAETTHAKNLQKINSLETIIDALKSQNKLLHLEIDPLRRENQNLIKPPGIEVSTQTDLKTDLESSHPPASFFSSEIDISDDAGTHLQDNLSSASSESGEEDGIGQDNAQHGPYNKSFTDLNLLPSPVQSTYDITKRGPRMLWSEEQVKQLLQNNRFQTAFNQELMDWAREYCEDGIKIIITDLQPLPPSTVDQALKHTQNLFERLQEDVNAYFFLPENSDAENGVELTSLSAQSRQIQNEVFSALQKAYEDLESSNFPKAAQCLINELINNNQSDTREFYPHSNRLLTNGLKQIKIESQKLAQVMEILQDNETQLAQLTQKKLIAIATQAANEHAQRSTYWENSRQFNEVVGSKLVEISSEIVTYLLTKAPDLSTVINRLPDPFTEKDVSNAIKVIMPEFLNSLVYKKGTSQEESVIAAVKRIGINTAQQLTDGTQHRDSDSASHSNNRTASPTPSETASNSTTFPKHREASQLSPVRPTANPSSSTFPNANRIDEFELEPLNSSHMQRRPSSSSTSSTDLEDDESESNAQTTRRQKRSLRNRPVAKKVALNPETLKAAVETFVTDGTLPKDEGSMQQLRVLQYANTGEEEFSLAIQAVCSMSESVNAEDLIPNETFNELRHQLRTEAANSIPNNPSSPITQQDIETLDAKAWLERKLKKITHRPIDIGLTEAEKLKTTKVVQKEFPLSELNLSAIALKSPDELRAEIAKLKQSELKLIAQSYQEFSGIESRLPLYPSLLEERNNDASSVSEDSGIEDQSELQRFKDDLNEKLSEHISEDQATYLINAISKRIEPSFHKWGLLGSRLDPKLIKAIVADLSYEEIPSSLPKEELVSKAINLLLEEHQLGRTLKERQEWEKGIKLHYAAIEAVESLRTKVKHRLDLLEAMQLKKKDHADEDITREVESKTYKELPNGEIDQSTRGQPLPVYLPSDCRVINEDLKLAQQTPNFSVAGEVFQRRDTLAKNETVVYEQNLGIRKQEWSITRTQNNTLDYKTKWEHRWNPKSVTTKEVAFTQMIDAIQSFKCSKIIHFNFNNCTKETEKKYRIFIRAYRELGIGPSLYCPANKKLKMKTSEIEETKVFIIRQLKLQTEELDTNEKNISRFNSLLEAADIQPSIRIR